MKGLTLPVGIAVVVVVALVGTAGVIFASYYMSSPSESPGQIGGIPPRPGPEFAPTEELQGSYNVAAKLPSSQVEAGARHDGNNPMSVAAQEASVSQETSTTPVEGAVVPGTSIEDSSGLGPDEQRNTKVAESNIQAPFPQNNESSTPTPEPTAALQLASAGQDTPGTPAPVLPASTEIPAPPPDDGGGRAVNADDGMGGLDQGPQGQNNDADDQVSIVPEKGILKYPNLGSRLNQLVASFETGRSTAEEAAQGAPLHQEESVAVTIYLSGNVDDVAQFLEDNGGDPRNVGEDYIEAYVPVILLGSVSERPGVTRVREIIGPEKG